MATLKEYRNIRIEKLNKLKGLGVNPYPAETHKTHNNNEIVDKFPDLKGKTVSVAGRIISIRTHSKLCFIDLKDASGRLQLYVKEDTMGKPKYENGEISFSDLNLLDTGDFVESTGNVVKTKTGEISVEAKSIRILSKALRPLPDSHTGFKDKESRLRKRYIDTNINEGVYQRFIRRAKFWEAHREFFKERGFLEMNIPVLENIPGGADANPFITHMDALDQDFYLRISQELYLKRLIGGGYEKVFEIGPRFRNEGISDEHLPEHMAMEFYWAYAGFKEGMQFVIDLFRYVADRVYGKQTFNIRGFEVDLSKNWEVMDYSKLIKDTYKIDVFNTSLDEIKKALTKSGADFPKKLTVERGIDHLWKEARKKICGPAMVINIPKFLSPLSKENPENAKLTLRFHPIIAGSELGNGFSELNDPIDQFERFKQQQEKRDEGDVEAQFMDVDFVEMLEYGMPPTCGYGHSERVFWFLEDVTAREGVPFTQLRNGVDEINKEIYDLK
ncbi:lysine--tRNA ligase [Patescibacteria group bacterium]|nr:lysine--tRNA ligase [Patescibacteria group bacterium]MBU1953138.1 lysine--tRNA ligase [Patescibacteria group bacterium]